MGALFASSSLAPPIQYFSLKAQDSKGGVPTECHIYFYLCGGRQSMFHLKNAYKLARQKTCAVGAPAGGAPGRKDMCEGHKNMRRSCVEMARRSA